MFMYGIAHSLSLALVSPQLFYSVQFIAVKLHVWRHPPVTPSLHSSRFGEVFLYRHHVWAAPVNKAVWFICTNCCIQFCSSTHKMQIGVCTVILGFFALFEDVPLVEFMYLVFIHMPGESYYRRLRSLLLCLCEVFQALINSLMCFVFVVVVGCVFCFRVVVVFGGVISVLCENFGFQILSCSIWGFELWRIYFTWTKKYDCWFPACDCALVLLI